MKNSPTLLHHQTLWAAPTTRTSFSIACHLKPAALIIFKILSAESKRSELTADMFGVVSAANQYRPPPRQKYENIYSKLVS